MTKITLPSADLIEDKRGNLWWPLSQIPDEISRIGPEDIIECGGRYFEILGHSDKRKAFWVKEISLEGAAENLEQEVAEYVEGMGDS